MGSSMARWEVVWLLHKCYGFLMVFLNKFIVCHSIMFHRKDVATYTGRQTLSEFHGHATSHRDSGAMLCAMLCPSIFLQTSYIEINRAQKSEAWEALLFTATKTDPGCRSISVRKMWIGVHFTPGAFLAQGNNLS